MSEIKVEYRGETIRYREQDNDWTWQGNGRGLISLEAARKSIDRALDGAPDKPKFQKRKALRLESSYSDSWQEVEVTSVEGDQFWISYSERRGKNKTRKKEYGSRLYADTPENRDAIARWRELKAEEKKLKEQVEATVTGMQVFKAWLAQQPEVNASNEKEG
jgi:hypothetical protein